MLGNPYGGKTGLLNATDYEEVTVDATVGGVSLTAAKITSAITHVLVRHENGPSNFRIDGGAPVSGAGTPASPSGWPVYDGDQIWLSRQAAQNLRAIRQGATNGYLRVIYFQDV